MTDIYIMYINVIDVNMFLLFFFPRQVISDHVLRLDQLIHEDGGSAGFASASDDTSSSATSSGAESEDDSPRSGLLPHPHATQQQQQHPQVGDVEL